MIYNRFGYGLLSVLFITQILPPDARHEHPSREDWFGNIVAGATLALLFFLKLSYFGVGAGLVLLATLADFRNTRRLLALACGLVPTTLLLLVALRFDVLALAHDLWNTIHARSGAIYHFGLTDLFELSTISLTALALVQCFLGAGGLIDRNRIMLFAAAIYTIAVEFLFVRTNASQGIVYPLYVVLILILLADLGMRLRARRQVPDAFGAAVVVMGLSLTAPMFFGDLRSLVLLTKYKTSAQWKAAGYRVEGEHLRDLAFYDNSQTELAQLENGHFFTATVNDGIDLLKRYSASDDMVTTISFDNPFSYALLRKPPRAGSAWLLVGNNVSAGYMLSNERMFADATVVMVPKYLRTSIVDSDQILFRQYEPYLLSHFGFVAESERWRLYRRLSLH